MPEAEICIEFTLDHIVYQSEDNDWTVLKVTMNGDGQRKSVTVVGDCYRPVKGAFYEALGGHSKDPKYGWRFKATSITHIEPTDITGIQVFLSENAFGIGPKHAEKIVNAFGDKAIDVLVSDPHKVHKEVSGVPLQSLLKASNSLSDSRRYNKEMVDLYGLLSPCGFHKARIVRVLNYFESDCAKRIKDSPFAIMNVPGVSFNEAFNFYRSRGGEKGSITHQCAALKHTIRESIVVEGNTWISRNDWGYFCHQKCDITVSSEAIDLLVRKGDVALDPVLENHRNPYYQESDMFTFHGMFLDEKLIARTVLELNSKESPLSADLSNLQPLDIDQEEAIDNLTRWKFSLLTGPAGSGKTTLAAKFLKELIDSGRTIAACAPTGKAAKRLKELLAQHGCVVDVKTVHRLLEPYPIPGVGFEFTRGIDNPLQVDIIFLDEGSMMSTWLSASFFRAVDLTRTRVVWVADLAQLPPVGSGCVLRDMIKFGVPCGELTKVRRAGGSILTSANMIRRGKVPKSAAKFDEPDINWIHRATENNFIPEKVLSFYRSAVAKRGLDSFFDMQIITPLNSSREEINLHMQRSFNLEPQIAGCPFKTNDKIVFRKNRWLKGFLENPLAHVDPEDRYFDDIVKSNIKENDQTEVFCVNGDYGTVLWNERGQRIVQFYDPNRYCLLYNKDPLELAYCVTVHVSQGSEWPLVFFCIPTGGKILRTRELYYTGFTRARDLLVTIGSEYTIGDAVGRRQIEERTTRQVHYFEQEQEFPRGDDVSY